MSTAPLLATSMRLGLRDALEFTDPKSGRTYSAQSVSVVGDFITVDDGTFTIWAEGVAELEVPLTHVQFVALGTEEPADPSIAMPAKSYTVAEKRKTHPNAYAPWSPQEDADLRAAFQSGQPVSDLSKAHGRNMGAIRSRLKKLGLL